MVAALVLGQPTIAVLAAILLVGLLPLKGTARPSAALPILAALYLAFVGLALVALTGVIELEQGTLIIVLAAVVAGPVLFVLDRRDMLTGATSPDRSEADG